MTVEADLRAWLIAHLRQRLIIGNHHLAADLRRLIDYPYDPLSRDPRRRGRIPGQLGVAERAVSEDPEAETFIMERGLGLVVDQIFRVYIDDNVAAEWAASPPDWGFAEIHAQGIMSASDLDCVIATAPTWSDLPTRDVQNSYTTLASLPELNTWINDPVRDPNFYSGLMQMLVEGLGPFEDIQDLKPANWPDWDPRYYGILRFRDVPLQIYRWWLIYLGPAGCRAVELRLHPLAHCLAEGMWTETWTSDQFQLAEAWVLRSSYLLEDDEGAMLISETEYGNEVEGFPLMAGWKFSHQRKASGITDLTQAGMVTTELRADAYDTRTYLADFTLVGDSLEVNLVEAATGRAHWGTAVRRNPLWIEAPGELVAQKLPTSAPGDVTPMADVYAVDYGDTGLLTAKRWAESQTTTPAEPVRTGSRLVACADAGAEEESWWKTATVKNEGGWSVGPTEARRETISGVGEQVQREFEIKTHGQMIDVVSPTPNQPEFGDCSTADGPTDIGFTEAYNAVMARCCTETSCDPGFTILDLPFGYRWQFVRRAQGTRHTLRRTERSYASGDYGGNALIIPAGCATAVCLVSGQRTNEIEILSPGGNFAKELPLDSYNNTRMRDFLPGSSGNYLFSLGRFQVAGGGYSDGASRQEPVCRPGNYLVTEWSSCSVNDPEGGCVSPDAYQTLESKSQVREIEITWVTGHGPQTVTPDWDSWSIFLRASVTHGETVAWVPEVRIQSRGSLLYQDVPGGDVISSTGHSSPSLKDAAARRFLAG